MLNIVRRPTMSACAKSWRTSAKDAHFARLVTRYQFNNGANESLCLSEKLTMAGKLIARIL